MHDLHNETKQKIKGLYDDMTQLERSIADFFIENKEKLDFSSRNVAKMLYVSEASLSRFAQKCNYKGYREFISFYEKDLEQEISDDNNEKNISIFTRKVYKSYQTLLQETFSLINEEQLRHIASLLNTSNKVVVYGMGSSGLVAKEVQMRFMRLGLDVIALTDSHMILMNAALAKSDTLVIAISLSGKTKEITDSIQIAKKGGANVVFITSSPTREIEEYCDDIVHVAYLKLLDSGTKISPQFSILVIIDVLYSYYLANDSYFKSQKYNKTLSALKTNSP